MQDFPVDATQSFDRMRGRLPWPVLGRVTAHYQEQHANAAAVGARLHADAALRIHGVVACAPAFEAVEFLGFFDRPSS